MIKTLEKQLKDYIYLCKNLPDPLVIIDEKGKIVLISDKLEELCGYKKEELRGKNFVNLSAIFKKDLPLLKEKFQKRLAGKKVPLFDFEMITKSGRRLVAEVNGSLIKFQGKKAVLLVIRDVTEIKKIEKAFRKSEEKYKDLTGSMKELVYMADPDTFISTFVNNAVLDIYGYSAKQWLSDPKLWGECIYPEDKKKTLADIIRARKKGKDVVVEYRIITKDNKIKWLEDRVHWIKDGKGKIISISGICLDVTERKESEIKLQESEEKFRLTFENAKDAIFWADIQTGLIINCNKSAEKLLEKDRKEIINRHQTELHPPQKSVDNAKGFKKHVKRKGLADRKTEVISKSGRIIPVQISSSLITIKGKTIIQGIFHDISREKEIDKAKTEFVSLASHQLRTPLSTVSWYAEMLLAGDAGKLNQNQKKYLEEVYQGNQKMISLVNSLLNVSRIELGTLAIEPELVNLIKLSNSVLDEFLPQIKAKKLKLAKNYDKNLPMVNLDLKLMLVIFQNLFSNAIKYTPIAGRVGVEIKKQKSDVLIKISDTGYGIPKHQQVKMFTKLFRADNVVEKVTEGTGLGLYITKSVVEQFDGKIRFESEENKGTTFYVTIPLKGIKKKDGTKGLAYSG